MPKYIVVKNEDVNKALSDHQLEQFMSLIDKVCEYREKQGEAPLEGIIVFNDCPEYNEVRTTLHMAAMQRHDNAEIQAKALFTKLGVTLK